MRLAFATIYDPHDPHAKSGTGHAMPRALEAAGASVSLLGPLDTPRPLLPRVVRRLRRRFDPGLNLADREPPVLRAYARQLEPRLASLAPAPQAILSTGVLAVAHLRTRLPLAIWTDCTLASIINYYDGFTGLSRRTIRLAQEAEARTLRRADLLIFYTRWAADSAIRDYACDPARVHVVAPGANLAPPPRDRILGLRAHAPRGPWRLFWLGVEWRRKGADLAIAATQELVARGRDVELSLVGCEPPDATPLPPCARALGFLDKRAPGGEAALTRLFEESHAFVLPARAECGPRAIAEALAHALPVISTSTGGIPSMYDDGVEGRLLDPDAPPAILAGRIADAIEQLLVDDSRYAAAARAARDRAERQHDWGVAGRAALALLRRLA